jgi:tetratricopeptide (TPR) repeat protein
MLSRYAETTEPKTAERIAKASLLLPLSGPELIAAVKLVNVAIQAKSSSDFPWFQFAKALAEYRQGRFESAVTWIEPVLQLAGRAPERDAAAWMLLALSRQRLGRTREAQAALTNGTRIIEDRGPKPDGVFFPGEWGDWAIANLLQKEATALMSDPADPKRPSNDTLSTNQEARP